MRILVTGSRGWSDRERIGQAIQALSSEGAIVVHGACPAGADLIADEVALSLGLTVERHPARWRALGKSAGFQRNAEMVALGADICLAFIATCDHEKCAGFGIHGSHGASHTADLAEKAGIPTRRFLTCP